MYPGVPRVAFGPCVSVVGAATAPATLVLCVGAACATEVVAGALDSPASEHETPINAINAIRRTSDQWALIGPFCPPGLILRRRSTTTG